MRTLRKERRKVGLEGKLLQNSSKEQDLYSLMFESDSDEEDETNQEKEELKQIDVLAALFPEGQIRCVNRIEEEKIYFKVEEKMRELKIQREIRIMNKISQKQKQMKKTNSTSNSNSNSNSTSNSNQISNSISNQSQYALPPPPPPPPPPKPQLHIQPPQFQTQITRITIGIL
ncbi:MAG: hypothetical protein EZS28_035365 [Streblomastix strix]|uniref:Uncharacterized protein n=1 Tax=Streblomastix strix TaxID=222440 RepID=A0A5J4UEP5_9EUKA|nr:MAG: hypothetical protein EZS28_035365 [Streblomastix strix]